MKLKFLLLILFLSTLRMVQAQTVVDIIVNSPNHNTLEAAVLAAELQGTLSGEGPFTVFAPTDDAFAALPAGTVETLLEDPQGLLTTILLNHVVGANALSSGLSDGQAIVTLNSGKTVKVTINNDGVFIDDAQVTVADIIAENGVVHVIDAVLLPANTVVDVIVGSADHNTLEAAVGAAGLVNTLNGAGPFTVFAPTDAAFAALPEGTVEALLEDPQGLLTTILLNHVAGANALSSGLTDGQAIVTLNSGKTVKVTINNDGVFIDDAQVTVADIVTDNGVVHVIDAVLLPANTVVDVIVGSADHSTLEAAVGAAGLVNTLNGAGPFTVFAPTDAAFAALPEGTVDAFLEDPQGLLTNILLNHVAGANALSSDLTDGQAIVTLNSGKTVKVTINNDGVFIDDAQVTVADIVTDNGVVHVIDAVLLPANTVVDVIVGSADHNTLEAAVGAAGLVNTLNGAGPFTVFAPTDAAFAALPEGTVEALLNDLPVLNSILAYHVVGATALSTDLVDGQVITTLNGSDVTVTINAEGVFINNAQVTMADIVTDNGVVHVIDAVLLPPAPTNTVFDIIRNSADHTTLEAAILASGLDEVLSGEEEYTVFAPTDAAFAALPEGTVEALLADPQGALTQVLLYHVAYGLIPSEDIIDFIDEFAYGLMLNNKTVTFRVNEEGVFINNAKITVVDLVADNGIVHVIDAVLLAPDSTIIDVVRNSEAHTILESLLDLSEFSDPLEGYGPFTLFAPTDDAINALGSDVINQLLENDGLLEEVLTYHIVGGLALSSDLSDGQVISTLLDEDIRVTINAEGVFINNAKVIVADIITDNGVVHVIDAVLIPSEETNTVFDIIENSPDHNILEAAIVVAGLDEVLSSEGPFTVFAPTDEAFEALPEGTIEALLGDIPTLTSILTYHVVGSTAFSSDLADGQVITTLNGSDVTVSINANGIFINDALVIVSDIVATNGVVHVIDAVLLPPAGSNTIFDIIANSPDHTTLEAAVVAAGLDAILKTEGTLTVFAPTDDAFAALPAGTVEALLNDIPALTAILTYHAVDGLALSTDLVDGQKIATFNGAEVTVTINANGVFINNAKVTVADILADNGVVHVIDAVLLPPPSSSNDVNNTLALNITPNPAVDKLKIDVINSNSFAEILEIINIQGKAFISQTNISLDEHIDISQLPSGIYMLKVGTKEGTSVRKFVKQ